MRRHPSRNRALALAAAGVIVLAGAGVFALPALDGTCHALSDGGPAGSSRQRVGDAVCGPLDAVNGRLRPRPTASRSAQTPPPAFPLKPSETGRYLVDQSGEPFLIVGDSPQAMVVNLSEDEAEAFLDNRRNAGFNTVWINLLCNDYTGGRPDGSTLDGIPPFRANGDLSTPNEAYFARADAIIHAAAERGMLVIVDPIETGGWLPVLQRGGRDAAYRYGVSIGTRYRNVPNIIWMHGNDFQSWRNADDDALVQAVAQGVQQADSVHLNTLELDYELSASRDDTRWAASIQLDAAYTYRPTYAEVLQEYNLAPPMPVFMVEANYEFEHDYTSPWTLRRQAYWAFLSGSTGQLYGNKWTWPFLGGWKAHLDTPGSAQMGLAGAFFGALPWYDLVPDQDHALVVAGNGTFVATGSVNDSDYATAALSADRSIGVAYLPTGAPVSVDLSRLRGPAVRATWFDPTNGSRVPAEARAGGTQELRPPGNNAEGAPDWVLLLESR